MISVVNIVGRIRRAHRRPLSVQQTRDVILVGGIAAEQPVIAEEPEIAAFHSKIAGRCLQGRVQIEHFQTVALLPRIQ
jgi:hypothetical protein